MAHLRSQGVRLVIYLDDFLLIHQSKELLQRQVKMTNQLLESLGFTINLEKLQLRPAQWTQFLGFILDSRQLKSFLPEEKLLGISQECQNLLGQTKVTI